MTINRFATASKARLPRFNSRFSEPEAEATGALVQPDWVSDRIVDGLRQACLDTSLYSGVCARRGRLSMAIEAGVLEVITWMQSGTTLARLAEETQLQRAGKLKTLHSTHSVEASAVARARVAPKSVNTYFLNMRESFFFEF